MNTEQLKEDIKDLDIALAQAGEELRLINDWHIHLIDKKMKLLAELNGNN